MKKIITGFFISIALFTGCTFTHTPALNSVNISDVDFSNVDSMKKGVDCSTIILGIIGPFGDSKLTDAVKNANISKVKVVEYERKGMVLYAKDCICVYGE